MGYALTDTVQRLLHAGLSDGTHRMYQSAYTLYEQFLQTVQFRQRRIETLPIIDVNIIICFVAFCADKGMSHSTIKQYLTGIKHHYVIRDMANYFPDIGSSDKLKLVLRGVKRSQKTAKRSRLPITYSVLQTMVKFLLNKHSEVYTNLLLSVACTMGFFGFLRCGEFTSRTAKFNRSNDLCIGDIQIAPDFSKYTVHLKISKTDSNLAGVTVPIFANGSDICPVVLMKRFYNLRVKSGATKKDPLFLLSNGEILSRNIFIGELRNILRVLKYDHIHFHGHSLRRGAATSAHAANISVSTLQALGRWSSEAWKCYVDVDDNMLRKAQLALCSSV